MSLYIVGSCSKITRNIVLQLAKNNQYKNITIGDILPVYEFHNRFYTLQKDLAQTKSQTKVSIDKLIQPHQLFNAVNSSDDVLFVTHDYYQNVASKTKLMKLVAEYAKNKSNLVFATPVQYDHYGYSNPQQNYMTAQNQIRTLAPNSTIIRSDIQDKTQFFAYYNHSKNIIQDQLLKLSARKGFAPSVVNSNTYAQVVADNLRQKSQGKVLLVKGQKQLQPENVQYNRTLDNIDWAHAKNNIRNIASKYTGIIGEGAQTIQSAL